VRGGRLQGTGIVLRQREAQRVLQINFQVIGQRKGDEEDITQFAGHCPGPIVRGARLVPVRDVDRPGQFAHLLGQAGQLGEWAPVAAVAQDPVVDGFLPLLKRGWHGVSPLPSGRPALGTMLGEPGAVEDPKQQALAYFNQGCDLQIPGPAGQAR